ncbi:hypothetical protein [Methylobacterium sp. WL19]|uniref:hypothetical protein n=1 Tax=Methylobacterium sp. WL19 TaxID=2603896 RepID=UPI0011C8B9C0|nr:hypothetical protein [Methylobacterium sp. WL19]TXN26861.1 hypothetical protein FV220_13560 [Methylobacterium sp. WL19]
MICDAELTGSGFRAMSDRGEVTVSYAYGAGYVVMLVTHTGLPPFEVPLSVATAHGVIATMSRALNSANIAKDTEYADRLVPRHAAKA